MEFLAGIYIGMIVVTFWFLSYLKAENQNGLSMLTNLIAGIFWPILLVIGLFSMFYKDDFKDVP